VIPTDTPTAVPTTCLDNRLLNSGFESWTVNGPAGPPDEWTRGTTGFTAEQETTVVRSGSAATRLTWTSTTTQQFTQEVSVVAGASYDLRLAYYDNDSGGRIRLYCYWRDDQGAAIGSAIYTSYSSDLAAWQTLELLGQTAPANAATLEYTVRMYDITGWPGSATVYVDDAELCGPAPPTPTSTPAPPTDTPLPVTDTPIPPTATPPPPTDTPTPGQKGDVDGNGRIDSSDALLAFHIALGIHTPTPEEEWRADADSDGDVDSSDALCIFQYALAIPGNCLSGKGRAGLRPGVLESGKPPLPPPRPAVMRGTGRTIRGAAAPAPWGRGGP
jgi:hypothetical protein